MMCWTRAFSRAVSRADTDNSLRPGQRLGRGETVDLGQPHWRQGHGRSNRARRLVGHATQSRGKTGRFETAVSAGDGERCDGSAGGAHDRDGNAGKAERGLLTVVGDAVLADAPQLGPEPVTVGDSVLGTCGQSCRDGSLGGVVVEGEQSLADSSAVGGKPCTDPRG